MTATEFTPFASFGGGVLIGLSAVLVMVLLGRVTGISGIITGAMAGLSGQQGARDDWRGFFLLGLIAAPLLVLAAGGTITQTVPDHPLRMGLAGLLVGFGTALGSGCTSGHGVCGLARLSRRSFAAVLTFMASGFVTVFVMRHILGIF